MYVFYTGKLPGLASVISSRTQASSVYLAFLFYGASPTPVPSLPAGAAEV